MSLFKNKIGVQPNTCMLIFFFLIFLIMTYYTFMLTLPDTLMNDLLKQTLLASN